MPIDDERCCFCRSKVEPREAPGHAGWVEIACPACGPYRAERQFWLTAHFKKARLPVVYRHLARWLEATRDRAAPVEIPFEGWERVAPPAPAPGGA